MKIELIRKLSRTVDCWDVCVDCVPAWLLGVGYCIGDCCELVICVADVGGP